MRDSDRILYKDLAAAGLTELAARAERGEWNDYFGPHSTPQHHLIECLKDQVTLANMVRKRLIGNVVDGKYDGTKEESDEWAASEEGQGVLGQLPEGFRL